MYLRLWYMVRRLGITISIKFPPDGSAVLLQVYTLPNNSGYNFLLDELARCQYVTVTLDNPEH